MRSGLLATGVVLLVAWPFVRGYGRDPTIPSLLDRNYAVGVAAAIGATWIAVAVWIAVSIALAIVVGRRRGRRDR
jgi:membrane protein implicated in regulation of membrane protease activity